MDYTQDANCQCALLMEVDENPLTDSSQNTNTAALYQPGYPDYATASPPAAYSIGYYDWVGPYDSAGITAHATINNLFAGGGSFVAWIKPITSGNGIGRITDKRYDAGWYLGIIDQGGGLYKIRFKINRATTDGQWETNTTYSYGSWHHFAITYDADLTTNDPIIYIDGSLVAITENTTPVGAATDDSGWDLYIGNASEAENRVFDGSIDEVAAFDDILISGEVADIKNNGLLGVEAPNPYPVGLLRKDVIHGYNCFVQAYVNAVRGGYDPLKLPDGTTF